MVKKIIIKTARIFALQNAIQFEGKAELGAVTGKVIAALRKEGITPHEIIPLMSYVVDEINQMSLEDQKTELKRIDPSLLKKKRKERDFSLPELSHAKKGEVVTRFPPEPNGYLHIGHAKASIVDHEYARMYEGKFILRFDDTNPENVKLEFYDAQKEDLQWLELSWDKEYNSSDHLPIHYKLAEQLINQGDAYVCTCPPDSIKKFRFEGKECSCRKDECKDSLDLWRKMISTTVDGAVLRLKGDMCCENTAMRDPTLFRIIENEHPLQGTKYRVWPTYDFAGAIEDSLSGVTHPFRTKEYELRDECYFRLLNLLNLRKPHLMEFARLSIEGMPVSKRKIKHLIDKHLIKGYDDIRLPTLRGLKKRGIQPEAIRQFVFSQGISKVESRVSFSILESFNRKLLDTKVKRYFFVKDPVQLYVANAPMKEKILNFHPLNEKLGTRTILTKNTFFIPAEDIELLYPDDVFRLKDLFNVKIIEKNKTVNGIYIGDDILPETKKIQWTTEQYIPMKIFIPKPLFKNDIFDTQSLETVNGYAEHAASSLKTGDIIQFERFGFVKIERTNEMIKGILTHK